MATPSILMCSIVPFVLMIAQTLASEDECKVDVENGRFFYHVQNEHPPELCECESWTNGTHHVLANCAEKDSRWILNHNKTHLVTSQCFETVIYTCHCGKKYFNIICTANCTQGGMEVKDKNHGIEGLHYHIIVTLVLILLMAVTGWLMLTRLDKMDPKTMVFHV